MEKLATENVEPNNKLERSGGGSLPLHWERYRPVKVLGQGGFGIVFLCLDRTYLTRGKNLEAEEEEELCRVENVNRTRSRLGRDSYVAVKAVSLLQMSDEDVLSVMNEIAILKCITQLNQENGEDDVDGAQRHNFHIIKYLDSFMDDMDHQMCVVTEYMNGGDVADLIESYQHKNQSCVPPRTTSTTLKKAHLIKEEPQPEKEEFGETWTAEGATFFPSSMGSGSRGGGGGGTTVLSWGRDASFMPPTPLTQSQATGGGGGGDTYGFSTSEWGRETAAVEEEVPDGAIPADATAFWISSLQICNIIRQTLIGLSFLHHHNILHRDIKASNLYLDDENIVKIGDFGVAKMLKGSDEEEEEEEAAFLHLYTKTFVGTPFYISPEICLGEEYSFSTDIWSLGVVAYELYTLRLPFFARNLLGQIHVVTEGKYNVEWLTHPHKFSAEAREEVMQYAEDTDYFDAGKEPLLHYLVQTLVEEMLNLNPFERLSAGELLEAVFGGASATLFGEGQATAALSTSTSLEWVRSRQGSVLSSVLQPLPPPPPPQEEERTSTRHFSISALSLSAVQQEVTQLYHHCLSPSLRGSVSLTKSKKGKAMTEEPIEKKDGMVNLSQSEKPSLHTAAANEEELLHPAPWIGNADIFSHVRLSPRDDSVLRVHVHHHYDSSESFPKDKEKEEETVSTVATNPVTMSLVTFERDEEKCPSRSRVVPLRPPALADCLSLSSVAHLSQSPTSTSIVTKAPRCGLPSPPSREEGAGMPFSRIRPVSAGGGMTSPDASQIRLSRPATPTPAPPPPLTVEPNDPVPPSGVQAEPTDMEYLLRQKIRAAHARRQQYMKSLQDRKKGTVSSLHRQPNGPENSREEELRGKLRERLNELYALHYRSGLRGGGEEKREEEEEETLWGRAKGGKNSLSVTQLPSKKEPLASILSGPHSARFPNTSNTPPRSTSAKSTSVLPDPSALESTLRKAVAEASARETLHSARVHRPDPFLEKLNQTLSDSPGYDKHHLTDRTVKSMEKGERGDEEEEDDDDDDDAALAETLHALLQTTAAQEFLNQAKNAAEIENNKLRFLQNEGKEKTKDGFNPKRIEVVPRYRKPKWEAHEENNCYQLLWESSSVEEYDDSDDRYGKTNEGGVGALHFNPRRGKPKHTLDSAGGSAVSPEHLRAVRRWRWSYPPSADSDSSSSSSSSEEEEEEEEKSDTSTSSDDEEESFVYLAYYEKESQRRYFNYTLPVTLEIVSEASWKNLLQLTPPKTSTTETKKKKKAMMKKKKNSPQETSSESLQEEEEEEEKKVEHASTLTSTSPKQTEKKKAVIPSTTDVPHPPPGAVAEKKETTPRPVLPSGDGPLSVVGSSAPQEKRFVAPPPPKAPAQIAAAVEKKKKPKYTVKKKKKKKKRETPAAPPVSYIGSKPLPVTLMLSCIRPRTRLSGVLFRLRRAVSRFPSLHPILLQVDEILSEASRVKQLKEMEGEPTGESTSSSEGTASSSSLEEEGDDTTTTTASSSSSEESKTSTQKRYDTIHIGALPLYYYDPSVREGSPNNNNNSLESSSVIPLQSEEQWREVQRRWWGSNGGQPPRAERSPFLKLFYVWKNGKHSTVM